MRVICPIVVVIEPSDLSENNYGKIDLKSTKVDFIIVPKDYKQKWLNSPLRKKIKGNLKRWGQVIYSRDIVDYKPKKDEK